MYYNSNTRKYFYIAKAVSQDLIVNVIIVTK